MLAVAVSPPLATAASLRTAASLVVDSLAVVTQPVVVAPPPLVTQPVAPPVVTQPQLVTQPPPPQLVAPDGSRDTLNPSSSSSSAANKTVSDPHDDTINNNDHQDDAVQIKSDTKAIRVINNSNEANHTNDKIDSDASHRNRSRSDATVAPPFSLGPSTTNNNNNDDNDDDDNNDIIDNIIDNIDIIDKDDRYENETLNVSFFAYTPFGGPFAPAAPLLPLRRSITITGSSSDNSPYPYRMRRPASSSNSSTIHHNVIINNDGNNISINNIKNIKKDKSHPRSSLLSAFMSLLRGRRSAASSKPDTTTTTTHISDRQTPAAAPSSTTRPPGFDPLKRYSIDSVPESIDSIATPRPSRASLGHHHHHHRRQQSDPSCSSGLFTPPGFLPFRHNSNFTKEDFEDILGSANHTSMASAATPTTSSANANVTNATTNNNSSSSYSYNHSWYSRPFTDKDHHHHHPSRHPTGDAITGSFNLTSHLHQNSPRSVRSDNGAFPSHAALRLPSPPPRRSSAIGFMHPHLNAHHHYPQNQNQQSNPFHPFNHDGVIHDASGISSFPNPDAIGALNTQVDYLFSAPRPLFQPSVMLPAPSTLTSAQVGKNGSAVPSIMVTLPGPASNSTATMPATTASTMGALPSSSSAFTMTSSSNATSIRRDSFSGNYTSHIHAGRTSLHAHIGMLQQGHLLRQLPMPLESVGDSTNSATTRRSYSGVGYGESGARTILGLDMHASLSGDSNSTTGLHPHADGNRSLPSTSARNALGLSNKKPNRHSGSGTTTLPNTANDTITNTCHSLSADFERHIPLAYYRIGICVIVTDPLIPTTSSITQLLFTKYTVYPITIRLLKPHITGFTNTKPIAYTIYKRYRQFHELYVGLVQEYPDECRFFVPFPPKFVLLDRYSPTVVAQRLDVFNELLAFLVLHPVYAQTRAVVEFLTPE